MDYNAHFKDVETQMLMLLMDSGCDLAALLLSCSGSMSGTLGSSVIKFANDYACTVLVAANGYPEVWTGSQRIKLEPQTNISKCERPLPTMKPALRPSLTDTHNQRQ